MAILPKSWREREKSQFLIASQIPNFPLMKMHCSKESLTSCQITRGCFVNGNKRLKSENIFGLAISKKRELLLLGDYKNHEIAVFKYNSCHHVTRIGTIEVPPKIYPLRSIFIDKNDNLWISSIKKDHYHNASVYMWLSKDW